MAGERIKGETALSYEYFCLYRDQEPGKRSLRDLVAHEVDGKKRVLQQFGKWSTQHNWQERVGQWDIDRTETVYRKVVRTRQSDIRKMLAEWFTISKLEHRIYNEFLSEIIKRHGLTKTWENFDPKRWRQASLAYNTSREHMKELIGFNDEEAAREFGDE